MDIELLRKDLKHRLPNCALLRHEVDKVCDLAHRTEEAEAEAATLRAALQIARKHVADSKEQADNEDCALDPSYVTRCHLDLTRVDAALQSAPPASEKCPGCGMPAEKGHTRCQECKKTWPVSEALEYARRMDRDRWQETFRRTQYPTRATTGERKEPGATECSECTECSGSGVIPVGGDQIAVDCPYCSDPAPADRLAHDPIADAAHYGMGFNQAPAEDVWKRPEPSDALAAWDRLEEMLRSAMLPSRDTLNPIARAIRQALLQPVPAVPQNIRNLPTMLRGVEPEMGNESQRDGWLEGMRFAADELERAIADTAAPEPSEGGTHD